MLLWSFNSNKRCEHENKDEKEKNTVDSVIQFPRNLILRHMAFIETTRQREC